MGVALGIRSLLGLLFPVFRAIGRIFTGGREIGRENGVSRGGESLKLTTNINDRPSFMI